MLTSQRPRVDRLLSSVITIRNPLGIGLTILARVSMVQRLCLGCSRQSYRCLSTTSHTENALSVEEMLGKPQPLHFGPSRDSFNDGFPMDINSVGQGKLTYDVGDENPTLIISSAITAQHGISSKENGTAFLLGSDLPLSVISYQIKEEYPHLQHISFHEASPTFRPSFKYSQHFKIKDLIRKAIHNPHRGFFVSINGNKIFIQIPTFEERTHLLSQRISGIERQLKPLRQLKEKCDNHAVNTNKRLAQSGMVGLCTYFGIMAKLTWWDYGWDVMEPFTYFTGVGVSIFGYLYFLKTMRDYSYESITKYAINNRQMVLYRRYGFNLKEYQALCTLRANILNRISKIGEEYI